MFASNKLYSDYLLNFEEVAKFYEYNPHCQESFKERSQYLTTNYAQDREVLSSILEKYNSELGAGTKVLENIELLKEVNTQAVVTGQQAGVLTGPLYTIYKAITAILLARKNSQDDGQTTVPIFWVASEDHDYQEVNHLHLINNQNQLLKLELPGQHLATSVGQIEVGEELLDLIDKLVTETYATEFRAEIINTLKEFVKESSNLADFFSRTMLYLFNDYGLIIFDPMWKEFRELSIGIYQQIIKLQSSLKQSLETTDQHLLERGYSLQVDKEEENTHLFIYLNGERNVLLKTKQGFASRNGDFVASLEEVLNLIEEEPTRFSPNVIMRPLVQDYLLPTLAYVGGPSEIAYHAQLKKLYLELDLEMPVLYPRQSMTIVEGRIADYLHKYNLSKEDILEQRLEDCLEDELAAKDELNISQLFGELKEQFEGEYQELLPQLKEVDENLEQLGVQNLERILGQVEYLEEKTKQFHKRNNEVLLRQFKKLARNLFPKSQLQERVLNIFPYLIKYSLDLIADLIDYFDLSFEHQFYFYEGVDGDEN